MSSEDRLRARVLAAFEKHKADHGESCDCDLGIVLGDLSDAALAPDDTTGEGRDDRVFWTDEDEAEYQRQKAARASAKPSEGHDVTAIDIIAVCGTCGRRVTSEDPETGEPDAEHYRHDTGEAARASASDLRARCRWDSHER